MATNGSTTTSNHGGKSASCSRNSKSRTRTGFAACTSKSRCRGCLRLLHYDRVPKQRVRLNRRNIFARDGNHCQYCGKRFATSELSLDHVVPTCRGGDTSWENLVCACVRCNVRKGGRTPQEAGHQADQEAGAAEAKPAVDDQARQSEVRELEDVFGQRVLVGGFEMRVVSRGIVVSDSIATYDLRLRLTDYSLTSGSFFSVITGHCGAISALSCVNGFHSSGTLSS